MNNYAEQIELSTFAEMPALNIRLRWTSIYDISDSDLSRLESILSAPERKYVEAARTKHLQRSRLLSRAILREELARATGVPENRLQFETTPSGKPYLSQSHASGLRFSVSRSHELLLHAFTEGGFEIGVDVEKLDDRLCSLALVQEVMNERKQQELLALGKGERMQSFFCYWVAKEAVLKATGCGLSDLSDYKREDKTRSSYAEQSWQVKELSAPAGFVAAVAAPAISDRDIPIAVEMSPGISY